jgi:hypothetical protein
VEILLDINISFQKDQNACFYKSFTSLKLKVKICPITGLNRPTGFQEVKAPRYLDIGT